MRGFLGELYDVLEVPDLQRDLDFARSLVALQDDTLDLMRLVPREHPTFVDGTDGPDGDARLRHRDPSGARAGHGTGSRPVAVGRAAVVRRRHPRVRGSVSHDRRDRLGAVLHVDRRGTGGMGVRLGLVPGRGDLPLRGTTRAAPLRGARRRAWAARPRAASHTSVPAARLANRLRAQRARRAAPRARAGSRRPGRLGAERVRPDQADEALAARRGADPRRRRRDTGPAEAIRRLPRGREHRETCRRLADGGPGAGTAGARRLRPRRVAPRGHRRAARRHDAGAARSLPADRRRAAEPVRRGRRGAERGGRRRPVQPPAGARRRRVRLARLPRDRRRRARRRLPRGRPRGRARALVPQGDADRRVRRRPRIRLRRRPPLRRAEPVPADPARRAPAQRVVAQPCGQAARRGIARPAADEQARAGACGCREDALATTRRERLQLPGRTQPLRDGPERPRSRQARARRPRPARRPQRQAACPPRAEPQLHRHRGRRDPARLHPQRRLRQALAHVRHGRRRRHRRAARAAPACVLARRRPRAP